MALKAVIFDLDGTLYDRKRLPLRLIRSQLKKGKLFYLYKERTVRRKLKGLYFGDLEGFEDNFFNEFRKKDTKKWFYEIYLPDMVEQLRNHYSLDEKIVELMRQYHDAGMKTAVFSDYGFVKEKLEALNFDFSIADYLFEAPELGGLKPCREAFEKICKTLGVQPEECLVIGDRDDTDGAGALSVGMQFKNVKRDILE